MSARGCARGSAYVSVAFLFATVAVATAAPPRERIGPADAAAPAKALPGATVLLFDNGDTDYSCCNEVTAYTLADDFELPADATLTAVTMVVSGAAGSFPANWDGSLGWWVYADGGGQPGAIMASGAACELAWAERFAAPGNYDLSFSLDSTVALSGGTRYWFGVHLAGDWSSQDELYWGLTSPGSYSTAFTATTGSGPWSDTFHHLAFTLRGTTATVEATCLHRVASWTYGSTGAVVNAGDYAYFGNGTYLEVADISNPEQPQLVSEIEVGSEFWGGDIAGGYLYLPMLGGALGIFDLSNPASPSLVTAIDLPGSGFEVVVEGDLAYVSGSRGVYFFDLSAPGVPRQVGFFPTEDYAYAVAVDGSVAYVAAMAAGMYVVDVSDPTSPSEITVFPTASYTEYVAVSGGIAYLADGGSGLVVLDVSNPASPFELATVATSGWAESVRLWSGLVVLSATDSLSIYDVTTPAAPSLAGQLGVPGSVWMADFTGSYALLADHSSGLRVVDLATVATPVQVAQIETPGDTYGTALRSDDVLVVATAGSLRTFDLSDPTTPAEIGSVALSRSLTGYDVELVGELAVIGGLLEGVMVVDLSDPASPVELGFVDLLLRRIAVSGDHVYAATVADLQVVDLSDPAAPTVVGTSDPMPARDVAVLGSTAFVAARSSGLVAVDISQPGTPTVIGGLSGVTPLYSVAIWNGLAACGGYQSVDPKNHLVIADLAVPASPSQVTDEVLNALPYTLAIADGMLFAGGYSGIEVVNLSNPAAPAPLAFATDVTPRYGAITAARGVLTTPAGVGFVVYEYGGCAELFSDGFESGGTGGWSAAMP